MKWISVKDRLPEQDVPVLVFRDNDFYVAEYHTYIIDGAPNVKYWEGKYPQRDLQLTDSDYWMELPKGPEDV